MKMKMKMKKRKIENIKHNELLKERRREIQTLTSFPDFAIDSTA